MDDSDSRRFTELDFASDEPDATLPGLPMMFVIWGAIALVFGGIVWGFIQLLRFIF